MDSKMNNSCQPKRPKKECSSRTPAIGAPMMVERSRDVNMSDVARARSEVVNQRGNRRK